MSFKIHFTFYAIHSVQRLNGYSITEVITVYFEKHAEHVNTFCGQKGKSFHVTTGATCSSDCTISKLNVTLTVWNCSILLYSCFYIWRIREDYVNHLCCCINSVVFMYTLSNTGNLLIVFPTSFLNVCGLRQHLNCMFLAINLQPPLHEANTSVLAKVTRSCSYSHYLVQFVHEL